MTAAGGLVASRDMANVLKDEKKQQIIALGRLGWPLRRIEQETGVRRETASAYLKAAGVGVRPPGAWGRRAPAKPANEVTTGSEAGRVERTANPSTSPNNPNPENLSTKEKAKAKSAKPANEVTTGLGAELEAENAKRSVCEPFREAIELGLSRGRNATAIWQDLVSESGFSGGYQPARRSRHSSHPGRALAGQEVRYRSGRGCLRGCSRNGSA